MNPRRVMFLAGFALYAISFLLVSTVRENIPQSAPDRGYESAAFSLVFGFGDVAGRIEGREHALTHNLFELFSLLGSGLINVVFLVHALALTIAPENRSIRALGPIVLALLPFCWVVFHYEGMSPRVGYYLWTAGILAVLSSRFVAAPPVVLAALRTPALNKE